MSGSLQPSSARERHSASGPTPGDQLPPPPDHESGTLLDVLKVLAAAVAVVDDATWEVTFENARFFQLFPPSGADVELLPQRIPSFDADRARSRLDNGRPYSFEATASAGPREVPLQVALKPLSDGRVLVEGVDVSKEKEIQYMLDSYSKMAERNARDLEREKERVERLLLNVMPRTVFEEMRDYGTATPQRFEQATILMLDFVGFTDMAVSHDASATIAELNDIFSAFDRIVETFGAERIRTIGDAYMAVSGLPDPTPDHAANVAKVALRMRRYLERRNASHQEEWLARIGMNTGTVIGSLVGVQKYVYDLFGPGVNLAARMEAVSEPMRITLTAETAALIEDDFITIPRGEFDIKGFGTRELYFLEGEVR
jgi:adenylate cyclase